MKSKEEGRTENGRREYWKPLTVWRLTTHIWVAPHR